MTGTVLLVRHGETTWNRDGRIQGWADSSLTDRGREQARALGSHLAAEYDLDRLVASDLQRTRETAALLDEAGVGPDPAFERAWRERDFGDWQGLTRAAIAERHPEYDPDGSLLAVASVPGGESLDAFEERVLDGWDRLVGEVADGGTVAVVTHGGPIRAVLAAVSGRDLAAVAPEFSPANCGLTAIRCETEPAVLRRDVTNHLSL
ncbi:histidine phosphatase family protein [Halosimplex amylolyticum]|uniref:histidine phosphatase family protein n=1 Tax=Halosimplex amylolyticum TaxID=3396616 RepID=UPI003F55EFAC